MLVLRAGEWGLSCLAWREMVPALRKLQVAGTRRALHPKQPVGREMWALRKQSEINGRGWTGVASRQLVSNRKTACCGWEFLRLSWIWRSDRPVPHTVQRCPRHSHHDGWPADFWQFWFPSLV